ncbi:stage V sporulation protein E [Gordoniibacillus kamchatkensis]|uniref:Probable peptidoglycan glycosyltransferase FtsW n=1 Tax=Gordoniibacillus kamchatkensis TaxID=1590651 RepID=A0ABR5AJD6_9BACL|nr:putative lipid II flippase FtsW [Paenibacillus sp. VKM B-2647]KIL41156.1 stage V sporulation protein E [Paenibacillus sp. VKM B-2647]
MSSPRRGTPDFLLLFLTFLLVCFGLAMVFSASYYISTPLHYLNTQAIAAGAGTVGMILAMNVHYTKLRKLVLPIFAVIVGLLLAVLVIGSSQYGAKSWIKLGPFNLQPTEFAKIGIVLYLANLIGKKEDKFRDFKTGLLPALIVLLLVITLILLQPDFGSCVILLCGAMLVILAGGANLKHLFLLAFSGAAVVTLGLAVYIMRNGFDDSLRYKWARVTSFLNPWSQECRMGDCYQIVQSLYAFGHGGITGAGFGQGIQKLQYLPKAYNDFIFAIIGEEFGFIGATLFLLVYLLFIWRGIIVALRCPDLFGTLTGIGIMGMIALQALVNLGGVTSSIPMTGVTLPLISYGGSSLMATLISIGILLGISREQSLTESKQTKATKKPSVPA